MAVDKLIVPAVLVVVGVIHLLPSVGVFGAERLNSLYGMTIDDADLTILMRHRAVLFGLLGAFLIYAAFTPALYLLALIAATASVVSFILLAMGTGAYNEELRRVLLVDVVAAVFLAIGFVGLVVGKSG